MGTPLIGDVIINGEHVAATNAAIPVDDIGLLRGYGCFEALRSYDGLPFRLGDHLDRLEHSAAALFLPLPPRSASQGRLARCGSSLRVARISMSSASGHRPLFSPMKSPHLVSRFVSTS